MGLVDDGRIIGLRDDPASAEALTPAILDRTGGHEQRFYRTRQGYSRNLYSGAVPRRGRLGHASAS
jgi:hypothetical protein